jgi:hypothetical protein
MGAGQAARAPFHAGTGFGATVDLGGAFFFTKHQTRQRLDLKSKVCRYRLMFVFDSESA